MQFMIDESENEQPIIFKQSQQYTLDEFCQNENIKHVEGNFNVLNLNARSLLDKLDDLQVFLRDIENSINFTFDVITIQETWLDSKTENLVNIPGYNFICKHKVPSKRGGGLGIFIKESHTFKVRNDLFQLQENVKFDGLFIEIISNDKKNIIIGSLYRSPKL